MRNDYNDKTTVYVNDAKEIEYVFDNFQKQYLPDINDEQYIDLCYRIMYFFDHSGLKKLSPENNDDLYTEQYGEMEHAYKEIMTVPKNHDKYFDFEKGTFIPVCRFKKFSPSKSYDNEVVISVDTKKNLVWANVTTTQHVYKMKNSKQPLRSHCYCVANYCIPSVDELLRGTAEDILAGKNPELQKLDFSADVEKLEEAISQSVLHVSRMDIDVEHKNTYVINENGEDVNLFNDKEIEILNKYFGEIADPPHFHFVYKDYVLKLNSHDSSALAINVNGLTNYLIDLSFTNSQSDNEILKHDFGMPFNDIKKGNLSFDNEVTQNLIGGVSSIYNLLSDEEKETFITSLLFDLNERMKLANKQNKTDYYKILSDRTEKFARLTGLVTNLDSVVKDEEFSFDPLTIMAFEASALNQIYKLSQNNKTLEYEIAKIGNGFYNTIEYCLSKLDKGTLSNNKKITDSSPEK